MPPMASRAAPAGDGTTAMAVMMDPPPMEPSGEAAPEARLMVQKVDWLLESSSTMA